LFYSSSFFSILLTHGPESENEREMLRERFGEIERSEIRDGDRRGEKSGRSNPDLPVDVVDEPATRQTRERETRRFVDHELNPILPEV
jgi:hypothetical protein